jgi:hypothetical protein
LCRCGIYAKINSGYYCPVKIKGDEIIVQEIIIDEEFKSLLPELDPITYSALEENIIQNGCRDAIVLWRGILIDGHNRYRICQK